MGRVFVRVLCVLVVSGSAAADPSEPYVPPPFTRFPDEPDDLPPLPRDTPEIRLALRRAVGWAVRGTTARAIAGVHAPLDLAVGVELDLPLRMRVGTTVGMFPRSVERAINHELVDRDVYTAPLGDLVDASLDRVLLWHAYAGIKPWLRHGLVATVGLAVARAHGDATVPQIADALGEMVPDDIPLDTVRIDLASRLRMLELEVGWEWRFRGHWSVRVSLGAAITRRAHTRTTIDSPFQDPRICELADRASTKLDDTFLTYAHTPLISSFVGFAL